MDRGKPLKVGEAGMAIFSPLSQAELRGVTGKLGLFCTGFFIHAVQARHF